MAMEFRRQNGPSCLLSAVCQLYPELDHKNLECSFLDAWVSKVTSRHPEATNLMKEWGREHLEPIVQVIENYPPDINTLIAHENQEPPNLDGRGILVLFMGLTSHAVSFENGMILDPNGNGATETWEHYKFRAQPRKWWVTTLEERELK